MYKKVLLIFFFSTPGLYAAAQDSLAPYDTAYIESYRDYLVLTSVFAKNSNTVKITDNNGTNVSYSTDMPWHMGIALDYKWITLELTRSSNKNYAEKAKANTQAGSIGFGFTGRKLRFQNFLKIYQGYYLENPEYENPAFNPKIHEIPTRQDLTTIIYFANLNYTFNHLKFSNMASLWQLERQKKSAGSFTVGLSFALMGYSADSSLIAPEWEHNFNEDALITGYGFMLLGVNAGYLHTFSFFKKKNLFSSLAFIPGISYQAGTAQAGQEDLTVKKESIGTQTELRASLGYNHRKWYTSLSINFYLVSNNFAEKNSILQDYGFVRFVVGYKIKLPENKSKFLKFLRL